jgi:hypothetical protein
VIRIVPSVGDFVKIKRKRQIGTITSYPAMDVFRRYLFGEGTLEEFRKVRLGSIVTPLYEEIDIIVPRPLVLLAHIFGGVFGCATMVFCVYLITTYFAW